MRPLDDIKVLDFSTLLPGPLATLCLAEAGATVIKIEQPGGGDALRGYPPGWPGQRQGQGQGLTFALLNRGKRSLALDLKDQDQRALLDPLIAEADVLVEQFRPGVMARLGLDYESLCRVNPRLVYCAITGYGQTGPKADRAGHDLNYMGDAGLLALSHGPLDRPSVPPALVADIAGGSYPAVISILLALMQRDRSGEGAFLDISMTDNLFPFAFWALAQGQATGQWPRSGAGILAGGSPRYRLYPTADGKLAAVAALEDKFWAAFCGLADLHTGATADEVALAIAGQPAAVWAARFAAADCCCSIVQDLEAALKDPHFQARGLFERRLAGPDGDSLPALPVPLAPALRGPATEPLRSPALGDDNVSILSD